MIRERMRHRKNLFHRMLSVVLVFALAGVSVLSTGKGIRAASGGTVIYLDGVSGDDGQDGESKDEAVATFSKAKKLAGKKGTIRVCGTVTVSDSQSWSLKSGVKLKRASGFTDAVAHVTGSLKLSGITLFNTDISGSGSVSGLAGRSPASDISVPSTITLVQPKALSEVSLSDQCFGTGSFAWANGSFVPDKYETQAQIIFSPSDTDVHDYSGLKGWNGDSQTVIRSVKVLTQSFLEEEKKEDDSGDKDASEDSGKDKEASDDQAADADKDGDGKTDGEKDPDGDGKSEDNSGSEDGKTDGESGKENQNPEDGKTDGESGKEDQNPEDGKTDNESGKEDQNPEDGKTDSESGKEDQNPEDGKTDGEPDQKNPEDGKSDAPEDGNVSKPDDGSDTSAEGQDPADGMENTEEDGGSDGTDGENKPADETDGKESEELPGGEDKKDAPADTRNVEKVEQLLAKLPESVGSQADVDAVVQASVAYDQLSEEDQAAVSKELTDKMYEAQSRALGYNRVSLGVTVQGDLPWYIQFRASAVEGRKIDDSTIRTLLESYEFKLWNLITDSEYKLDGKTVTVLMAAPAVKDVEIVIYHYLEDGTVEHIIPEIEGDQMSFATSSFSPFSVIGVSVAGSTELVGSTGFSYIDKDSGSGSGGSKGGSGSTGNKGTGSSAGSSKDKSGSTGNKSTGSKSSSSSTKSTTASKNQTAKTGSGTGVKRATTVGTGDTNNLLGYVLVGSGAAVLMLFAAYMVYVQYKRKSYSRRS